MTGSAGGSAGREIPEGSALVVAHPDDEILWFSSVVDQVDLVIICFLEIASRPDWTRGRKAVAGLLPLRNVQSLGLTESEVFNGADWESPVLTEHGLEVHRSSRTLPGFSLERYRSNFESLKRELAERLAGYRNVFTHNPWGEYGHEEHVQVNRAVSTVQRTYGFTTWCPNYVSNVSLPLMLRYVDGFQAASVLRRTNPTLTAEIAALYRANACWTWPFDDYKGFDHEAFFENVGEPRSHGQSGGLGPMNVLRIQPPWEMATPGMGSLSGLRRFVRAVRHRNRT